MDNTTLEKSIFQVYDLGSKVKQLYDIIEDNDGEVDDEEFSLLQLQKNEVKQAGIDIIRFKSTLESQSKMIDEEIGRLTLLKAKRDKQAANIEKALMWILLNFGEQDKKGIWRLDLDIAQLTSRKNPESVVVEDESKVPDEYKKYELIHKNLTKEQLDKIINLLKENYSKGEENIDIKINHSVIKKELKPKLEQQQQSISIAEAEYKEGIIDQKEYEQAMNYYQPLGAYIKEGSLNLVIK